MRIVVTGTHGQIAQSLAQLSAGDVSVVTVGRPELDFEHLETIGRTLIRHHPDAIVNAAAFTAVDKAEGFETTAHLVNAEAAGEISATARALDVPIVHLSTDYVFDGRNKQPYVETDLATPINAYGRSKLAGEAAVAQEHHDHVILRTAWVFSPFGNNFLKTMLKLGETRGEVRVVADQIGAPTYAPDIAKAIVAIVTRLCHEPQARHLRGIFHLTNDGCASWADFAALAFKEAERHGRKSVAVTRIATGEYPTRAKRPVNSRLNCDKLFDIYGLRLPAWQSATSECVSRLIETTNGSCEP